MVDHTQQIMWTALPNGVGRKGPLVSVLVSPRLGVDGAAAAELSKYPDWLDWPKVLRGAKFTVQYGRKRVRAEVVSRVDSEIWQGLFRPELIVENHAYEPLSGRRLISYSAREMEDRLVDAFRRIAGVWPALPDAGLVADVLDDFARAPSGPDLLKRLSAKDGGAYLGELTKAGVGDLARFHGYHAPHDFQQAPRPDDTDALIKGIDFHRMVALVGQHTALLRACGLVLDLHLDGELPSGKENLSVSVDWPASDGTVTKRDVAPRLACVLDGKRFEAVPKAAPIVGRRLDLARPAFRPVQVDLDGGIIKLTGTGTSMRNRAQAPDGKTEKDAGAVGLPTLRTGGIMVAQEGRATELSARLTRSDKANVNAQTGRTVSLFAEDVTKGLRIDVHDGKRWQSLCRTDVTYSVEGLAGFLKDDDVEGIVQLGLTEAPPGSPPELANTMKLSEGLFQWDGWSLAAERPGVPINNNGDVRPDITMGMLPATADARAHRGSLPRLRFGTSYRIRARLVDVAHNSEPWTARDGTGATKAITFRRFEPVAPPAAALVRDGADVDVPGPGASLLRMVIRSGDSIDTPAEVEAEAQDLRLLFPARSSVEMAERHGALDGDDGRPSAGLYGMLSARDEDLDQIEVGDRTYPIADAGTPTAPWLPDAMAHTLAITLKSATPRTIPGVGRREPNDARHEIPAEAPWPHARPLTLRLAKGDPLPFVADRNVDFSLADRIDHDSATNRITLTVPRGETVLLSLSQMFGGKGDPADLWGIADWLKQQMNVDQYQALSDAINRGEHWAFTPALEMEMIHATQRPVVQPAPVFHGIQRVEGQVDVGLSLTSPCHAESTADLVLDGRWIIPSDGGPDAAAPSADWQSGRAFRRMLAPTHTPDGTITLTGKHAFGDTRYRRVRYRLGGSSRFAEFFPPEVRDDRAQISSVSDDVVVHIPNAAQPPAPTVSRTIPVFDWLRDTVGTRQASYRRAGLRIYLDRPWFESGFGEMLGVVLAPASLTDDPNASSSALEQTGGHVTRWAADPIWAPDGAPGKLTSFFPGMEAFSARARPDDGPDERWPDFFPEPERDLSGGNPSFSDLSLPDENGSSAVTVDVAGHPVSWDADQGQYYADVMMDTDGVYQPFVSLAVSRFHPVSAPDCHLSPALRLEALQVLPERLVVARKVSLGWNIFLYGYGHGVAPGEGGDDRPSATVVRVEVQRATTAQPGDLDWETVEDTALADAPHVTEVNPNSSMRLSASMTARSLFRNKDGELYEAYDRFADDRPPRLMVKRMRAPGAGGGDAGDRQWRIRVTEWERHDGDFGPAAPGKIPASTERLVFAETFRII